MEAELVSRANSLISVGKTDEANKIICWLYAYWKLRGQPGWRGVYVTGCLDEELENLVTGNYPRETVFALLEEFNNNPSVELFAKIAFAEALYGFGVKPDNKSLLALARQVGFDRLSELSGEVSLSKRGRVDEPWLVLTNVDTFRRVVSRWLEGLKL